MGDNQWDRTIVNTRERPVSSDINQAQSQADRTLRYLIGQLLLPRYAINDERAGIPVSGFVGDAFNVRATSPLDMAISIAAGQGFQNVPTDCPPNIDGVNKLDDLDPYKPLLMEAEGGVTAIPSGDLTNARIDIVEVKYLRRRDDPTSRDVLNPVTGVFEPQTVNKALAWTMKDDWGIVASPADSTTAIGYKTGVPSGSPAPPPVTAGYVKIAEIAVGAGATQIAQSKIQDLRQILGWGGVRRVHARAAMTLPATIAFQALRAQPGILAAANISGSTRNLYVKAGDLVGSTPIAKAHEASTSTSFTLALSVVTVDSTLQTNLANAAETDPPLNVAIGQQLIKATVSANGTYTFDVAF